MSTAPTVYFIDDSATMREVIKIAFRRENMNVVACHDAVSALKEIEEARPDVVISDVIMPSKDGYEVCQFIKNHPGLSKTPVILMSGVVNRAVAERAFSVRADELLRKPFQPQDLIARVRHLLGTGPAAASVVHTPTTAAMALSSIFASVTSQAQPRAAASAPLGPQPVPMPRAVPAAVAHGGNGGSNGGNGGSHVTAPAAPVGAPIPMPVASAGRPLATSDAGKLKVEIMRLEGLVKKLQSELQAEREYSRALEEHVKTLQEAE